jgi:Raf kinase inhibitor-like YbhB/YbcL family protein
MSISHTVKTIVQGAPALLTGGVPGARAGDEYLAFSQPELVGMRTINVKSTEFADLQEIPLRFSKDGQNVSPPLSWSPVSSDVKSLVLLVEDPDAPLPKPFVHWIAFNMEPHISALPEGIRPDEKVMLHQGKNSTLKPGWTGMAPPKGDTPHHYHFQLFGLDRMLQLEDGCGRSALLAAMANHVVVRGDLIGTFQR